VFFGLGRMLGSLSGEGFLKPWIPTQRKSHESRFRSGTFTGLKQNYENSARASRSVMPIEAVRAVRSSDESNKPWNAGNRLGASCLRAASAKRSVMPWVNGNHWKFISRMLRLKSTTISSKTPSDRLLWEKTMNSPELFKVRQARMMILVVGRGVRWKLQQLPSLHN
jgi:hypothetical protein